MASKINDSSNAPEDSGIPRCQFPTPLQAAGGIPTTTPPHPPPPLPPRIGNSKAAATSSSFPEDVHSQDQTRPTLGKNAPSASLGRLKKAKALFRNIKKDKSDRPRTPGRNPGGTSSSFEAWRSKARG
ncbi:hypothetical protein SMMN14_09444 [Sphaerulina musiva]